MKVCWISSKPGNYKNTKLQGTGGWIGALQTAVIERCKDMELHIIFPSQLNLVSYCDGQVTYHPIYTPKNSKLETYLDRLCDRIGIKERKVVAQMHEIIDSISPDIVHIWGSEYYYISILKDLKFPSVVHIQGLATVCLDHYYPEGVSFDMIQKNDGLVNRLLLKGEFANYKLFKRRADYEKETAPYVKNWIGRTEWDKASSYCLNPKAHYYHCDELMRDDFRKDQWEFHYEGTLHIMTTVRDDWYKGVDLILKTARVLSDLGEKFEWNVVGISEDSRTLSFFEKLYDIRHQDVNVKFCGPQDGNFIVNNLLSSDVYVHSSLIENSSNAIAEAMLLGIPVIANYSGGTPSMLKEGSGILVPLNDASSMAHTILKMKNENIAKNYGTKARKIAIERNDPGKVVGDLLGIYRSIIASPKV